MTDTGSVKLTHEQIKEKTWPGQSSKMTGVRAAMNMVLPLYLLGGMDMFDSPLPIGNIRGMQLLEKRKCALPGCDKEFTPVKESECCCTKDHFLKLRALQKQKK